MMEKQTWKRYIKKLSWVFFAAMLIAGCGSFAARAAELPSAEGAGETELPVPETAEELKVDSVTVSVDPGEGSYYKFEPQEDSEYLIYSLNNERQDTSSDFYNLYVELYSVQDGKLRSVAHDAGSGINQNFTLQAALKKGTVYYYRVKTTDDVTATFTLCFYRIYEISSVTVHAKESYDAITLREELRSLKVDIQYKGIPDVQEFGTWTEVSRADEDGTRKTCYEAFTENFETLKFDIWDGDVLVDTQISPDETGKKIPCGDFTLKFYVNEEEYPGARTTIHITGPQTATEVQAGTENHYTLAPGAVQWYRFTAPASDTYVVNHVMDGTRVYAFEQEEKYLTCLKNSEENIGLSALENRAYVFALCNQDEVSEAEGDFTITARKQISSVEINGYAGRYDLLTFAEDLRKLSLAVIYEGESVPLWIGNWIWAGNDGSGAPGYLWSSTANEDIIEVTLWSGETRIHIPQDQYDTTGLPYGTYKIRVSVNQKVYAEQEISIAGPDIRTSVELGEPISYQVGAVGTLYRFAASRTGVYSAHFADASGADRTEMLVYEYADNVLKLMARGTDEMDISAQQGKEYLLLLRPANGTGETGGTFSIYRKIFSLSVDVAKSYPLFALGEGLQALSVRVIFTDKDPAEEKESIVKWQEASDQGYRYLYATISDGRKVTMTLERNGKQVSMPLHEEDSVPLGNDLAIRLSTEGISASVPVTAAAPKEAVFSGENSEQAYSVAAGETAYFLIPEQDDTGFLKIVPDGAKPEARFYKKSNVAGSYRFISAGGDVCQIEDYEDYVIALKNEGASTLTGKLILNLGEVKEFQEVTGLALEKSYSHAGAVEGIYKVQIQVKYTNGDAETVSAWNRRGNTLWADTTNGERVALSLTSGDEKVDMPQTGGSLPAGEYTLALSVSGNVSGAGASVSGTPAVFTVVHEWDDGNITAEPSCTEPGEKTYRCSGCTETETTVIEALGHNINDHKGQQPATCTVPGNVEYYTCSRCGGNFQDDKGETKIETVEIPALGHDTFEETDKQDAGCTTAGTVTYTCTRCKGAEEGGSYTEQIPAIGHQREDHKEKPATCTEPGTEAFSYCSACGQYFAYQDETKPIEKPQEIPAGHKFDEGVVTEKAGCTTAGSVTYTCIRCKGAEEGGSYTEQIPATGHRMEDHEQQPAACIEPGTEAYSYCTLCKQHFAYQDETKPIEKPQEIPATGHVMTEQKAKEATCTQDGNIAYYSCSNCGLKFADAEGKEPLRDDRAIIPKLGHHLAHYAEQPATCTAPGVKAYSRCMVCSQYFVYQDETQPIEKPQEIPAMGHVWTAWETDSPATVFAPEYQSHTCSRCFIKRIRTKGKKLTKVLQLTANKLTMQTRQTTSSFGVTKMAAGDSLKSVKSDKPSIVRVTGVKSNGTFKLTAGKTAGTAKLTITLKSGKRRQVPVTVKKAVVKTQKITGISKKLTLKKGQKYALKPVLVPVTSQDRVKYVSSNKNVATVSAKGVIRARKKGKTTVTVTAGAKKVRCNIEVR